MGIPVLRGTKTPQQQEWSQNYDQRRGLTGQMQYKGIDIGQMSTQAEAFINQGFDIDLSYKFGIAEMTVRTPDGEVTGGGGTGYQTIIDRWEVGVDEEKPSLFECSNFLQWAYVPDSVAGYPTTTHSQLIAAIIACAQQSDNASWGYFVANYMIRPILDDSGNPIAGETLNSAYDGVLGNLKPFILDYLRGATNFVQSKYIVRHTTSVPNNYSMDVSDFNIENIYTISQFLSEAQSSTLWILPLPAYLAYKVLNYPVPTYVPTDFQFGALKERANAVTAARNRIEISQEYLIDAWPIHTYGLI